MKFLRTLLVGLLCLTATPASPYWQSRPQTTGEVGSAPSTLRDNLISWWEMEEASGTREDAHGTNDVADNNTVTQAAAGKVGNAAQFTLANSEFLSLADNASLSMEGRSFSIAAWVYFDTNTADATLVAKQAAIPNFEYELSLIFVGARRFTLRINSSSGTANFVQATSFGTTSNATWYFVCASVDAVNNLLSISVNNGTVNTATKTISISAGTAPFQIGARNSAQFLNGRIDQVAIWDKVLSSSEITQLYNGGSGLSYAATAPRRCPLPPNRRRRGPPRWSARNRVIRVRRNRSPERRAA